MVTNAYMHRSSHGGWCCGMSHVFTFPYYPDVVLPAHTARSTLEQAEFLKAVPSYSSIINESYIEQTAEERLDELIKRIKAERSSGCIEVTLTPSQAQRWGDALRKRGFKEVNAFVNSNTTRTIRVYMLNT